MSVEKIDTLIVGAGQAGIALSEHLGNHGVPFLVLEKSRIAEAWRTARWDALVTNGPVWHDRFPNLEFKGNAPDEFVGKDRVADYIEEYANMVKAPVRTTVEVLSAEPFKDRAGFRVETSDGVIETTRDRVSHRRVSTSCDPPPCSGGCRCSSDPLTVLSQPRSAG